MPTKAPIHGSTPAASMPRHDPSPRGSAAKRGYGRRWQKASAQYLRENPLCVTCLARKRITPATLVDHKIPHKGDYELFWSRSNWQSMCKPDHDYKTATEDGGFGNGKARAAADADGDSQNTREPQGEVAQA